MTVRAEAPPEHVLLDGLLVDGILADGVLADGVRADGLLADESALGPARVTGAGDPRPDLSRDPGPGAGPVARAVSSWLAGRAEAEGRLRGPLLLPVDLLDAFLRTKVGHPVDLLLDGTGVPLDQVRTAVEALAAHASAQPAGAVITWGPEWTDAVAWGLPISVSVPPEAAEAVADLAVHTGGRSAVQAVLSAAGPEAAARAIRQCVDADLGFLVSDAGGLVSGPDGVGCLNLLAATRYALAHAADVSLLVDLLRSEDAQGVVDIATRMSVADCSVLRAFLTGIAVADPARVIAQAEAAGLIGYAPPR